MDRFIWNHFKLPYPRFQERELYNCDFIVYEDSHKTFHFFGHAVLGCLGYDKPNAKLQTLEASTSQPSNVFGKYLHEDIVKSLIAEKAAEDPKYVNLENWFQEYLDNCRGIDPLPICPR